MANNPQPSSVSNGTFSFSIIIPTYNRPRQLKRCLANLLLLNFPRDRFEVIIIDDGSTKPLDDIIRQFDSKLDITFIRQDNTGPAAARNAGIQKARGSFLAFTDDDCYPAADWLNILETQLIASPDHIVGGKTVNLLKKNPYAVASQLIVDIVYRHYNPDPGNSNFFASNNMAIPAERLREIGGFVDNFRTSEDRELCDRWLFKGYKMMFAPEAVVHHAHKLSLMKYCKQHFHYGRGAYRFHRMRAKRGSGTMLKEMKFHANLRNWILFPFSTSAHRRRFTLMGLLAVWQIMNTLGFFWEAARQKLTPGN